MRRALIAACVAAGLGGCGGSPEGAALVRQSALNLLELYVATKGPVDDWSDGDLMIASAACSTAATVITVYRPDVPEASDALLDVCAAVLTLLGQGA